MGNLFVLQALAMDRHLVSKFAILVGSFAVFAFLFLYHILNYCRSPDIPILHGPSLHTNVIATLGHRPLPKLYRDGSLCIG
ncbi:hypothetical protein AMTR_s00023p00252060 [Amborella trichopoda]|uniref:Uncharacterized protein n=1 Tax=Amborella trichopoda TaxID=13333 RepID=W1NJU0_AMBTC|nr:hypothetical protein AMTR_s00023p00252060 [Amborella trichopoda]